MTAYDFVSDDGFKVTVLSYGATLQSCLFPDGLDVVLGFDDIAGYLGKHPYFGAVIGRVANRIGGARLNIDGDHYALSANEGLNTLHGGAIGFNRANWRGEIENDTLVLYHISPDGDQGFPGTVKSELRFTLSRATLSIDMRASTDITCPVNLTHHSYFNLTDGGRTTCNDHHLEILSDSYTPMDADNLPTGEIKPLDGTAFDFRSAQLLSPKVPLDHNFIRRDNGKTSEIKKVAKLSSDTTGKKVIICSSQPCFQVYTGQFIPNINGKSNTDYGPFHGVAIEPQGFSDSLNHGAFPDQTLRPDDTYHQTIRYTFRTG